MWRAGNRGDLWSSIIQKMMKQGYEVYSGMLVGLPFQTPENLAEDILFLKDLGVDGVE